MSCDNGCTCGCCEGVRVVTPVSVSNRPGLDALSYRAGEHGSFLETMKARLSSTDFPALAGLGARTTDDPSIALLDGWATAADVLTFYQERLANEGYLRTATERRSVVELARLIGYAPRPGVAASVMLAYEIDPNAEKPVEIPAGAKAQSVPGPGELPQTFETSDTFVARKEWNAIAPRLERPQSLFHILWGTDTQPGSRLFLDGASTGLKPNDPLLLELELLGRSTPAMVRVTEVVPNDTAKRTMVRFVGWDGDEIPTPPELYIRRELLAFSQTPAELYPEGSIPFNVLTLTVAFLEWLSAQVAADPPDPDVEDVLRRELLVKEIMDAMENLRKVVTTALSEDLMVLSLRRVIQDVLLISSDINEHTGQDGGGPVGAQTDALAEALQDLVEKDPGDGTGASTSTLMQRIVAGLATPRSVPPRNAQNLERDAATLFATTSDVGTQAVAALEPAVAAELPTATRNAKVTPDLPLRVYALRQRSLLFGSTAPQKVTSVSRETGKITTEEWSDIDIHNAESSAVVDLDLPQAGVRSGDWVALDYMSAGFGPFGGISIPNEVSGQVLIARAGRVGAKIARSSYGTAGQTTRIPLVNEQGIPVTWFDYTAPSNNTGTPAFQFIRQLTVYTGAEELKLAQEPMDEPICGGDQWIETDDLYTGLESGRWVVVSGERTDVPGTEGVRGSELVMIDAVQHRVAPVEPMPRFAFEGMRLGAQGLRGLGDAATVTPAAPVARARSATSIGAVDVAKPEPGSTRAVVLENLRVKGDFPRGNVEARAKQNRVELAFTTTPGERQHTFLKLATPLAYCYRRDTVALNANVVKATHGETRAETLGAGDARVPFQTFALRQPPLTYVPANEPDGVSSTLRVYVNGVQWREVDATLQLGPQGRGFVTRVDDDGTTSVIFGDGKHGARLPTGVENVKAVYRGGIGKAGNVKKGQISQLLSRPLGVKGVLNPIEASGGADRDTRDQLRKNAPLAVMSLDRLVSTRDYADFSRTFAGIAKAASARLAAGGREGVYVTVAGLDDIPIPPSSDLYRNLVAALRTYGDPIVPIQVQVRELLMLVVSARISIRDDYQWEDVVDRVRAALLDRYGFEPRELGQSVAASEVIAYIQGQRGVRYVDLEALGAVSQLDPKGRLRSPQGVAAALKKVVDDAAAAGRPASFVQVAGVRLGPDGSRALPAQLAYLVPSLPESLILNRIGA